MTQLINSIHVNGQWPRDLTEVTIIVLKKKPKATKSSDHHTISFIAHTVKIVARILRRGKGTGDAIGMLRISEQTLDINDELCACFIDWQKAFDRVNWTRLMQILKGTGIDLRERRLISNLYMEQSVKVRLDQGETRSVKIGRGVRQGCCLSPILFNLYIEYLTKEALEVSGDFQIEGQVIHTVKYADDLVLLAKEETVLQGMIDKLKLENAME
jgi:hypothetical protein